MNKNNINIQSGGIFTKIAFLAALFLGAVTGAWALPGTGSTNLQTTAGVTTAVTGNELLVTAPNKSVLTWQAFGSGADTIGAADTLHYVLPGSNSAVLNIVAGNASTTVNGSIASNGNIFILNPNGVVVGGTARFEVNKLVISASDAPAFASYYFQLNGKLPSQDGLASAGGSATVNSGAIFALNENITITAKTVDIQGLVAQTGLSIAADGAVTVGSGGLTYIKGNLDVVNSSGTTVLGSVGNNLIITENITVTGNTSSSFNTIGTANVQTKSLTVTGGAITADRVNTNTITANGTNVSITAGFNTSAPVVNVTGNGTITLSSPNVLTANITNTGNGPTTVTTAGTLTLGRVQVEGAAGASFTGSSVVDTANRVFVYGPTAFTATGGNITLNKGNHSFGPVSVAATGDAVVFEDASLNLNVVNATKLTARSSDTVFQTPTTGVINSATNSVTAAGNITLGNASNVAGTYTLVGKNISLANTGALTLAANGENVTSTSTGAVTLNSVTTRGTLVVTSTDTVTQGADTKVQSAGATTFTGTGLTVTNSGNQFGALTIDVTPAGTAAVTEETTLNLASLKAANATLRSLASIITSSNSLVSADNFTVVAGADFVPTANLRAINPINVVVSGVADFSLLSLATNLNTKAPLVVATTYRAPTP